MQALVLPRHQRGPKVATSSLSLAALNWSRAATDPHLAAFNSDGTF